MQLLVEVNYVHVTLYFYELPTLSYLRCTLTQIHSSDRLNVTNLLVIELDANSLNYFHNYVISQCQVFKSPGFFGKKFLFWILIVFLSDIFVSESASAPAAAVGCRGCHRQAVQVNRNAVLVPDFSIKEL